MKKTEPSANSVYQTCEDRREGENGYKNRTASKIVKRREVSRYEKQNSQEKYEVERSEWAQKT